MSFLRAFRKAFLSPSRVFKSYSQCGEDAVIHHLLSIYQGPRVYVDVGCHHPKRGSNTFAFYRLGWRGLLIDIEQEKLLACRLARPRDQVICAAVSDGEREVDVFSDHSFSTLTTIDPQLGQSRGMARKATLTTRTLQAILEQTNVPKHFGFLSIDVEGQDLAVLKGLNLEYYAPELICIEALGPKEQGEVELHLAGHNYDFVSKAGPSCIFRRIRAIDF